TGNYIAAIRAHAGCHAAGIDPSAAMLAKLRSRDPTVRAIRCRAEDLALTPARFDLVFSVDVIHHVRDRARAFGEMFRVLRGGGTICTVTDSDRIIRGREPLATYFPETVEIELARYPRIDTRPGEGERQATVWPRSASRSPGADAAKPHTRRGTAPRPGSWPRWARQSSNSSQCGSAPWKFAAPGPANFQAQRRTVRDRGSLPGRAGRSPLPRGGHPVSRRAGATRPRQHGPSYAPGPLHACKRDAPERSSGLAAVHRTHGCGVSGGGPASGGAAAGAALTGRGPGAAGRDLTKQCKATAVSGPRPARPGAGSPGRLLNRPPGVGHPAPVPGIRSRAHPTAGIARQ